MARRKETIGIVSNTVQIFAQDTTSSTGAGYAGLLYNTSGLILKYRREGSSSYVTCTLLAGTLGTFGASTGSGTNATLIATGGMVGMYELGLPDVAFSSGARWVIFEITGVTGCLISPLEFELDKLDYQDNVRAGLTALPNTNAGTAGGVSLGDGSGRVTVISNQDKTDYTLSTTPPTAGQIRTEMDSNSTKLANLDVLLSSRLAGSSYVLSPTAVQIRTELDTNSTKLSNLDVSVSSRLAASSYAVPTTPPTVSQIRLELDSNSVKLANLDTTVSSRLASSSYTAPPTPPSISQIRIELDNNSTKLANLDGTISSRLASSSYNPAPTVSAIRVELDNNSAKLANLDTAVSSRSTFNGGAVASVTAPVTLGDKSGFSLTTADKNDIADKTINSVIAAPTSAPIAPYTLKNILGWLLALAKFKRTQSNTIETVYADDGVTPIATSIKSDDGLFNRNEYN